MKPEYQERPEAAEREKTAMKILSAHPSLARNQCRRNNLCASSSGGRSSLHSGAQQKGRRDLLNASRGRGEGEL